MWITFKWIFKRIFLPKRVPYPLVEPPFHPLSCSEAFSSSNGISGTSSVNVPEAGALSCLAFDAIDDTLRS